MKRFTWLLVATFTLTMVACGSKKSENGKDRGSKGGAAEFDGAKVKALSALDVPGFKRFPPPSLQMKGVANVSYEQEKANAHGKKAFVRVNAHKCEMCQPMDVEKWKANKKLKWAMLSPADSKNPNLVWQVEGIEAGGVKAISVYTRSFVKLASKVPGVGSTTGVTNAMTVYYNNGKNTMRITVTARGGPMAKNEKELATAYTKDELLAVARTFLATFGPKL